MPDGNVIAQNSKYSDGAGRGLKGNRKKENRLLSVNGF